MPKSSVQICTCYPLTVYDFHILENNVGGRKVLEVNLVFFEKRLSNKVLKS